MHACWRTVNFKGKSMLSKISAVATAVSFITLAGCAQTETSTEHGTAHNAQESAALRTSSKSTDLVKASDANIVQTAIENPALVQFDTQSVELSSEAQAQVVKLAAPAKRASK